MKNAKGNQNDAIIFYGEELHEREVKRNEIERIMPVSYTHLDVYKRQIWDCLFRRASR